MINQPKRKLMKRIAIIAAVALALAACGEEVPTSIVDQNQIISRENAMLNARSFVRQMGWEGTNVVGDSDSTISKSCRYGDGWASIKVAKDGTTFAKLKCQTNGMGKGMNGCLQEAEFAKKDYASQDGKCDSSITELPKLGK
jgi:hypothetical protein